MKRLLFILGLFILVAVGLAAKGESGGFIIENADDSATLSMVASTELNDLVANVAPHMIVEYANSLRDYPITPVPETLQTLLEQVEARIVVEYANANRYYSLTYPSALIGDTVAPQVSNIVTTPSGAGNVEISWTTDEYTISMIEYGTQSGVYTETVTDDWFRKEHQITLTGLTTGEVYYYRIYNSDRSGNSVQSAEGIFTSAVAIYLPIAVR